jgi:type VI secretion system protein ImpJ
MTAMPNNGRKKGRAQLSAREVPPPIKWHEGMLLAPQHFQQLSLRNELLVHYHTAAASPFHWGVRVLEIDGGPLVDGMFRVLNLEAVLPDGLVVHSSGKTDLSLDLKPRLDELRTTPVMVHLAVVAREVSVAERYASEERTIVDEYADEDGRPLPVLRPVLKLLLGDDLEAKYVTFPLARIEYRNEGFTRMRFEPPTLRVTLGSGIYELCNSVAERLRQKATSLAEKVRQMALLEDRMRIHSLVGELPAFEALYRSEASHPFPLYVAMCSLLGHVAGISAALVPPALAPYDHNDLFASFNEVRNAIDKMLDEGIRESYEEHRFLVRGDEYHLPFDPSWTGRQVVLGVRAPRGVSDQEMTAWVGGSVIASRSEIMRLRDNRVTGAERNHIDADAELVPPRGMTLYKLTPDAKNVKPGEDLVVINPGERKPRPESIVLFVRYPR